MTFTKYATETHNTPQKSSRGGRDIQYVVIHHAATTNADWVIDVEVNAKKEVSSGLVVKDDRIAGVVPEEYRAWSLADEYWDSVSLTIETANETGAPGWTISEASYHSLAKVVADWCERYDIPLDREHVIGHREVHSKHGGSYATACPGGIDLDRVVRDAKALSSTGGGMGGGMSRPTSIPAYVPAASVKPSNGEHRYTSTEQDGIPGSIFYGRVQTLGKERGIYPGIIDGKTGPLTETARIKITAQACNGWKNGPHTTTDRDGIPGTNYWTAVQQIGKAQFGYRGIVDGKPGPLTHAAENRICAHELNTHR